jgi:hypothetical protein
MAGYSGARPVVHWNTLISKTIFDGGITWVDAGYDERLGEMLRPLNQDKPLEAGYGDYAACDRDA